MPLPTVSTASHTTLVFAVGFKAEGPGSDPELLKRLQSLGSSINLAAGLPAVRSLGWHRNVAGLDLLTPGSLLAVLEACASRPDLVCAAWIAPPRNPLFAAVQVLRRARGSSIGFALGNEPNDGSAQPVAALLGLHMAVLRARTPAQWAAVEAVYRHGTTVAAGRELGISHQAVGKALKRSGAALTSRTYLALTALLDASYARSSAELAG